MQSDDDEVVVEVEDMDGGDVSRASLLARRMAEWLERTCTYDANHTRVHNDDPPGCTSMHAVRDVPDWGELGWLDPHHWFGPYAKELRSQRPYVLNLDRVLSRRRCTPVGKLAVIIAMGRDARFLGERKDQGYAMAALEFIRSVSSRAVHVVLAPVATEALCATLISEHLGGSYVLETVKERPPPLPVEYVKAFAERFSMFLPGQANERNPREDFLQKRVVPLLSPIDQVESWLHTVAVEAGIISSRAKANYDADALLDPLRVIIRRMPWGEMYKELDTYRPFLVHVLDLIYLLDLKWFTHILAQQIPVEDLVVEARIRHDRATRLVVGRTALMRTPALSETWLEVERQLRDLCGEGVRARVFEELQELEAHYRRPVYDPSVWAVCDKKSEDDDGDCEDE